LRECERRDIITIMETVSVLVRLGFILTVSYRSLTHMKDFFQEFLTNLSPLEFCFRKYMRTKVIVYSDSFNLMWSDLGFVVIDQETY
jgi:hypothetical protein